MITFLIHRVEQNVDLLKVGIFELENKHGLRNGMLTIHQGS